LRRFENNLPAVQARAQALADFLNSPEATQTDGLNTPQGVAAFLGQAAVESDQLVDYTERKVKGTYRGRGPLQLTGSANYAAASEALFGDARLVENPSLAADDPVTAARVAGWFWRFAYPNGDNLNHLADAGDLDGITRRVTGATKIAGKKAADRRLGYQEALARLTNCQPPPPAPVPPAPTTSMNPGCTDDGDEPVPGGPDGDGDTDC
jgi:predicted chitinase